MKKYIIAAATVVAALASLGSIAKTAAQETDGWKGAPRTFPWNPGNLIHRYSEVQEESTMDDCLYRTRQYRMCGQSVGFTHYNM
jgi:hypothetical protein